MSKTFDKNILRKKPFRGIVKQVATEEGLTHSYVSKSFTDPINERMLAIKKRIIQLMEERAGKIPAASEKLDLKVEEILKKL